MNDPEYYGNGQAFVFTSYNFSSSSQKASSDFLQPSVSGHATAEKLHELAEAVCVAASTVATVSGEGVDLVPESIRPVVGGDSNISVNEGLRELVCCELTGPSAGLSARLEIANPAAKYRSVKESGNFGEKVNCANASTPLSIPTMANKAAELPREDALGVEQSFDGGQENGELRVFRWAGNNSYVMLTSRDIFAMGGG